MKPIALLKTGNTITQIKTRFGDFEDWFAAGTGLANLLQVDVFRHQPLPESQTFSGVLITGSAAMVSAREAWSEQCAAWLKQVVRTGLPVLGVCYGHQLLAHALGGRVGPNPSGRQIGSVTVSLLAAATADPLLGNLPQTFKAQSSHSESVLEMPPGAVRLAYCALDENFAIRFADNVWGVQFHPEFSGPVISQYIRYRAAALREEGFSPEQLIAGVDNTETAGTILRRFADIVVAHDSSRGDTLPRSEWRLV